jgi:cell division protein FtsB
MSYYKIVNIILAILLVIFAVNTFNSVSRISQREKVIERAEGKLNELEDSNEQLKRKKAMVESQEFVEKEARNKLNLGKEGEIALILPSISPIVTPTPMPIDTSPAWQKWVKLFL